MRYVLLCEKTGLQVSEVALGTGRLGSGKDGGMDASVARATLVAFLDAGGNLIDTSSAYQAGRAEEVIGEVLSGSARDAAVIPSKYGRTPSKDPPVAATGSHRRALATEVEGSLKRLRTDRIDLLFAHFDDGVTPVEEVMRGLDDLVRAGKVLYVGLSNFPAWRTTAAAVLADMRGWAPLAVIQLQYNLLERSVDREHQPLAQAMGLGMMAWSPLAGGLLAGNKPLARDGGSNSADGGGVLQDAQAQRIVDTVKQIAAELNAEPADVAVSWVARKGFVPIIGPRNPDQLAGNLRATDAQLSGDQRARLDDASDRPLGCAYDLLKQQRGMLGVDDRRAGRVL